MSSKSYFEVLAKHEHDIEVLDKRSRYFLDIQKNHREDIDILYKYAHFLTIYSVILNVILIGVIICSIIMN